MVKKFHTAILLALSVGAASLSSDALAQTASPSNPDAFPIENLVIRVPAGMNITYSPKIALASGNTLPAAAVGTAYSFDFKTKATITHDEAPDLSLATWSLMSPAPSGLNISPGGVLSGTPINEGSYSFEVAAIYKGSKDTQVYVMEVTLDVAVALAVGTPPKGVVGQAYAGFDPRSLVQVSGDPSFNIDAVTWSVKSGSALPAGLTLNTNTGLIAGTPTAAFTGPVTLVATYKGEPGEQAYEFTVDLNIVVTLASATLPAATVGQAYEGFDFKTLLSVTGDPGYTSDQATWALDAESNLPEGMELTSEGLLTGTPLTEHYEGKTFEVVSTYKDESGQQVYNIVVNGINLKVTQITSGQSFTCVLTTAGGVKCWGWGGNGFITLGNGVQKDSLVPVDVIGLTSGVTHLDSGNFFSCAKKTTGDIYCWGDNFIFGSLGMGNENHYPLPVANTNLKGAVDVKLGSSFGCALFSNQTVKCWGRSELGQTGTGSVSHRWTPSTLSLTGVRSIFARNGHACALMGDDVLKCWGYNNKGQLGNGNKLNQTRPATVLGLSSGIKQVAMGTEHTCILYNAGNVQCWGSNQYGKLGNTSAPLESLSPVDVTGLGNVVSIEAGHHHTCAIINDGTAKCWGLNDKGQLGDGTTINKTTPVTMQGVSNIKQLSIEYLRTMALTTDGHLKFWGHNNSGTFGDGTTTDSLTVVDGPY